MPGRRILGLCKVEGYKVRGYKEFNKIKSQTSFIGRIFHLTFSAIWFRYDLSPITVKYVERRKPFYHFITTVC